MLIVRAYERIETRGTFPLVGGRVTLVRKAISSISSREDLLHVVGACVDLSRAGCRGDVALVDLSLASIRRDVALVQRSLALVRSSVAAVSIRTLVVQRLRSRFIHADVSP